MAQAPCLYIVDKTHPKYSSLASEPDWILSDEYSEMIEASIQSSRTLASTMYLDDRFEPFVFAAVIGDWITVKKQIESDIKCFLEGKLPDDLSATSLTATIQPFHGYTAAYQRRNSEGELELVKELTEFLQEASEIKIPECNLMVIRSCW